MVPGGGRRSAAALTAPRRFGTEAWRRCCAGSKLLLLLAAALWSVRVLESARAALPPAVPGEACNRPQPPSSRCAAAPEPANAAPSQPLSRRATVLIATAANWGLGAAQQLGLQFLLPSAPAGAEAHTAEEKQITKIFKDVTPSVVSIARKRRPTDRRVRYSAKENDLPPTIGSGFLWDSQHIITNNHVATSVAAEELQAIFIDTSSKEEEGEDQQKKVFKVELVGTDGATDTAVLRLLEPGNNKTGPFGSRPLPRGKSAQLEVGQVVYAIGNPFGFEHSMSRGIISGTARVIDAGDRPIRGCIQTDASINPGNSGGPLLDTQGKVIGVNTAIVTSSGASAGVGLAIPVDTVAKTVEAILKKGYVQRAYLGITFADDVIAENLQLGGILVIAVMPNSPASKAGFRPLKPGILGDVVTGMDGENIRIGADLYRLLDKHAPGDTVTMRVNRPVSVDKVVEVSLNVTLEFFDRKKLNGTMPAMNLTMPR